jgi:uncharacterized protein (DUF362 family)
MEKIKVALETYESLESSLKKAVESIDGFSSLKSTDSVLIKPNTLTWDRKHKIPPFGVFTTTRIVEDMVILLKEHGVTNIAIGEGAVKIYEDSPPTTEVMRNLGYEKIAEKYGVTLIDFNELKHKKVTLAENLTVSISEEVFSSDFFIDIPAMKTHSQTKVSLGFKNLKGCLKTASKRLCHHKELDLDYCVSLLGEKIYPNLVVIDGIYILEKGPIHTGKAHRANVIVASTDMLAADIVGTKVMGIDPADIDHLRLYAERNGRSLKIEDYDIVGEKLDDVKKPVKWDWSWNESNTGPTVFDRMGISGVSVPKYDATLCTGCSPVVNMTNIFIISAKMQAKGNDAPFANFEVLSGKKMQARPGYDKTLLIGNCIIKANKDNPNINEAVEIKGCPPPIENLKKGLSACGVEFVEGAYDYYLNELATKYDGKEEYDESFYTSS